MQAELKLDIRADENGNKRLHFPAQFVSDVHWGTKYCRAKQLAHMLEHTTADALYLGGDMIDGQYMLAKDKWNFAPWHRQGVAHVCRKAAQGTQVTYVLGNHEDIIRGQVMTYQGKGWRDILSRGTAYLHHNLCGKSIYGIDVVDRALFMDAKGRRIKVIHGDQYDTAAFGEKRAFWYGMGDFFYNGLSFADQKFRFLPGCEHVSLAAIAKKATKTIINEFFGVRRELTKAIDEDPAIDGVIYGHSHMAEIRTSEGGKKIMNDGCCTENVQTLVQDRHGNYAILEWHWTHLKITQENRKDRIYTWDELGLAGFKEKPQMIEDEHTEKADRLIRLMYRTWPPVERKKRRAQAAAEQTCDPPPLPHPRLARKMSARAGKPQALAA